MHKIMRAKVSFNLFLYFLITIDVLENNLPAESELLIRWDMLLHFVSSLILKIPSILAAFMYVFRIIKLVFSLFFSCTENQNVSLCGIFCNLSKQSISLLNILLAGAIVILLIILIFEVHRKEFYKLKRNLEFVISLPGPSLFSSFVTSLQIACNYKELITYIDAITKKYGNLTRIMLGTDMFIILSKPEDYKLVLTDVNGDDKGSVTKPWEMFLGDGILRASGATYRLRRKILQRLLNIKHLSEYVRFFDNYSNFCADTLEKNIDGPIFDLKPYIAQYSFNIFLATTVGIQGTAHEDENELFHWQEKLLKEAYSRIIKPWLQMECIFSLTESGKQTCIARNIVLDFIYSVSQKVVKQTTLQFNNEEKSKSIFSSYWNCVKQRRNDIMSKSCEVSDENFIDDIRTFYIIIQNTITELTSFIMLMLAMHPEIQEKLRDEISVIFINDKVDAQRLLSMNYFHMVFQETLRLFPIAVTMSRQLTGDIKLESCTLPEGCYVMIPIFAIHRNPAYWHKPLKFIPERFSTKNSSRPRYTYIPFGTGLRDCLGQRYTFLSVATIIVNLVRRFRFATTKNIDDIKISTDIILRAQDVRLSISHV